jgi:hypothetical protein
MRVLLRAFHPRGLFFAFWSFDQKPRRWLSLADILSSPLGGSRDMKKVDIKTFVGRRPPGGQMKTPGPLSKFVLAALLAGSAGGCVEKLALPVASVESGASSRPSIDAAEVKEAPNSAGHVAQQAPGLVVHIDPATGEILPRPVPPASPKPESQTLQSTPASVPQALETPSTAPGGGVKVNLNRQFHRPLVATIDADGKVTFEHRSAQQSPEERKQ